MAKSKTLKSNGILDGSLEWFFDAAVFPGGWLSSCKLTIDLVARVSDVGPSSVPLPAVTRGDKKAEDVITGIKKMQSRSIIPAEMCFFCNVR